MIKITEEWDEILKEEFASESYLRLREFLKREYSSRTIYPSMFDIFNSMIKTAFKDVKAVILGQDPYHEKGQAMGLSFSVPERTACAREFTKKNGISRQGLPTDCVLSGGDRG